MKALRPHRKADYITKICPVDYDPSLTCPVFLAFLDRIFEGSESLIAFIRRVVGYTLTGITSERAIFILYGTGANGKSTLLAIIRELLGDYATQTAADTLMTKRNEGIPNDIARLKGSRFVSATESDEGRCLAEGLVKRMTGGEDILTARFMRAEFFDFKPTFKLFLATNHKPVIKGNDPAIWDRLKLIPFNVRIPEDERDPDLLNKLKAELPGILAWAVEGCLEWQRDGLNAPAEVCQATEEYKGEMDRLADFIEACCVVDPNAQCESSALYSIYKVWCGLNGEEAMNQTRFGRQMTDRGYQTVRSDNSGRKHRLGIGILQTPNSSEPFPG